MSVCLRFSKQVYRWARGGIPAKIESEEEDPDTITVTFAFENMDYLANWLLRYGTQAEVLDPPELRAALRSRAKTLFDRYSK